MAEDMGLLVDYEAVAAERAEAKAAAKAQAQAFNARPEAAGLFSEQGTQTPREAKVPQGVHGGRRRHGDRRRGSVLPVLRDPGIADPGME